MQRSRLLPTFLALLAACGGAPARPTAAARAPDPEPSTPPRSVAEILGPTPRFHVDAANRPCVGPADAPVTLVEFEDFECPFTRRVEPAVEKLLATHRDDIRACFRHFLDERDHPHARIAAEASEELFVEKGPLAFYEARSDFLREELSDATVLEIAVRHGADRARLAQALSERRHVSVVKSDAGLMYEAFAEVVEDEIERARELRRAGVPADEVFSTIMGQSTPRVERPKPLPEDPARVRIRYIYICYAGSGAAPQTRTRDEAQALVQQLRQAIVSGEDFAAVARRHSDASNAHVGGEFGWLSRGDISPDIDSAALRLGVGETSQPVSGEGCFTLVQRVE